VLVQSFIGFARFYQSNQTTFSTLINQNQTTEIISKQNLPSVTYGLLHIAKVGGTEINGQLSMHYERVCGNKGYSYDAHQTNLRFNNSGSNTAKYRSKDSMPGRRSNRGMVPFKIMEEIGFEDCDYVAMEVLHYQWPRIFRKWYRPLELHIPCRDPIDHLMSMCNERGLKFDCNARSIDEIKIAIKSCETFLNRFSLSLVDQPNIHLKCFSAPFKTNEYLKFMGERLQRKSLETEYFHRATNSKREKEIECIWKDEKYMEEVRKQVMQHESGYYKFCNDCLGSNNDLLK